MKLIKLATLATALSFSTFAADSTANGSITLSGGFSPKVNSVSIALVDCGQDVSFNDCDATLESTSFGTHTQDASLALGNLDGESNVRYVKFEIKSKMLLFKNDYLKISKSLTSSANDVSVALEKMIFISAGLGSYGQQTLGAGSATLATGDIMVDTKKDITDVASEVYNSSAANPGVANAKVLSALVDNSALTVRGIISLEAGDEATSSDFSAVINVAFTGVDGNEAP
ncbi:hypothetical protein ABMA79_05140 [Halobacteriovorax sp. HFRX-2_2]|uniref:hypothetical protein n=1 Tax=unclassified Halobacteriovorax TaxID=2639665 RepID=UPI00371DC8C8